MPASRAADRQHHVGVVNRAIDPQRPLLVRDADEAKIERIFRIVDDETNRPGQVAPQRLAAQIAERARRP